MKKILTGVSQTQPWISSNPEKKSFRTAAIIINKEEEETKYLLATNKNIENIATFINTTLSEDRTTIHTREDKESLLRERIQQRVEISNLVLVGSLQTEIHRNFRKPIPEWQNEDAIYQAWSILIFETKEIWHETDSRIPKRYTAKELSEILKTDGSNGSSYLIREAYQQEHLLK